MTGSIRKTVSALAASVLLSGTVLGCSAGGKQASGGNAPQPGGQQEQIQLRVAWWGSQDRHDRTQKAIQLFQEKYPHIKVSVEFTGFDDYWNKLATQAAGQNLPDVIQMDYKFLSEYVERKLLAELDPYVQSGTLNLTDVDDVYLDGGKIGGKLYAVNLGANSLAMAYDPEMFQQAGIQEPQPGYTWEDLEAMARELKAKLGQDVWGMPLANEMNMFKHYLRQKGLWLYSDDGKSLGYPDDQVLTDFFNYWDKLRKDGIVPPPEVTQNIKGLEDELIVHKKSPVMFFHSNQIIALAKAANRPLKLTIFPKLAGGQEGHFIKPSQFFSVTTQSKQQEAGAMFIDFITNDLKANEILAAERGVPISKKVRDHLFASLDPAGKEMFTYVELAQQHSREIHPPDPAGSTKIEAAFKRIQETVNYGKNTPEQAAKQFREEAEKALK
ncbi:ABC transporter substrate-binding protein [Paenibacillus ginsengihumi]|uniref:ABC transporter substrate-binding protein n=1 Tax=Paenibacillus ginsengihumi TaxID=431596 RepID=UPI00037BC559|nr:extracellular solute-binding protein [Paenibacillus ginsengihumi]